MRNRRFLLLAGVLVVLNLALWLASPGLALRQSFFQQLLGPKLIRAEILDRDHGSTVDWRLDRGVITSVGGSQLTLREADGRLQAITVSSLTRVTHLGHRLPLSALAPRWRVLVTWAAGGPAQTVKVERVPRFRSGQGLR